MLTRLWERIAYDHTSLTKPGAGEIILCTHRLPPWRRTCHAFFRPTEVDEWRELTTMDELYELVRQT